MSEPYDPTHPYVQQLWRPQVPSPYATHQDLAPLHGKIGALEQGQQSIISTYAHLRGEMMHGFDEVKAAIRASAEAQTQEQRGSLNLSMREFGIIAIALLMAGAFLGRAGLDNLFGG